MAGEIASVHVAAEDLEARVTATGVVDGGEHGLEGEGMRAKGRRVERVACSILKGFGASRQGGKWLIEGICAILANLMCMGDEKTDMSCAFCLLCRWASCSGRGWA